MSTWVVVSLGLDPETEPLQDWRHCDGTTEIADACAVEYARFICTIRRDIIHTIHEAGASGGTVAAVFWRAADR